MSTDPNEIGGKPAHLSLERGKGKLWALLFISLAINLLLVFNVWSRMNQRSEAIPSLPPPGVQAPKIVERVTTNSKPIQLPAQRQDWRSVESDDYRKYVANLRSIGCPEKTIRDIIVADVNELYKQRFAQEFPPTNRIEYWKGGDPLANVIDEGQVARLQEFAKEKRDLISTLLGTDYNGDIELTSIQTKVFTDRLLSFLSPEKRDAMEDLERKYTAKTLNTYKDSVRGDNQSAKAVAAAKDEDELKILSPEEKFEYDLRRSNASMLLRVGLGDFEVTEQEFRGIFPAMHQFINDAGMVSFRAMVGGQGDPRDETLAARQELIKSLKTSLGDERFTQLMDGTGWNLGGD